MKTTHVGEFAIRCVRGNNRNPDEGIGLCMFQGVVEYFPTKSRALGALRDWRKDALTQSHLLGAQYKMVRFIARSTVTQRIVEAALRRQIKELRAAFGPWCGNKSLAHSLLNAAEARVPTLAAEESVKP